MTARSGPELPRRYAVAIGLGANLGDRRASLASATEALRGLAEAGVAVRVSRLYETEPVGPPQPRYLNAAMRLGVSLPFEALLDALLRIEAAHGRVRRRKWGPRTLDLDVLYATRWRGAEPLSFRSGRLTVPHPHLTGRAFALAPLLDVMPQLEPRLGAALAALGGPPPVIALPSWARAGLTGSRGLPRGCR